MKTLLKTALILACAFLSMNCACRRHDERFSCPDDVTCTAMFAMVDIQVQSDGQPIHLDDVYTVRESNGEIIRPPQIMNSLGHYIVLDDSYQRNLANRTEQFRFVGMKDGRQVVSQPFSIGADCCHIRKETGPEQVETNR